MHYTFRCKLDAGTPVDVIEGEHVYVEMETLDDLEHALLGIRGHYQEAIEEGISTAFLDQAVMRLMYPDGEDRPGNDPAPQVAEALANMRQAREQVVAVYADDMASETGRSLDSAIADIDQAIRFLTGEEVPS